MPLLCITILALCVLAPESLEVIQGATAARSDSLAVYAGGLVAREGEAGSTFGLVQPGKARRQLSYFVIFKHRLSAAVPLESMEEATADGDSGSSKQSLSSDGRSLQIDYQVQLDATSKKVSRESLALNAKSVDLARGRVLLVDLTASPPRWERRKLDLPAEVGDATSARATEELVRKVLAGAGKKDRRIKEFLEATKK